MGESPRCPFYIEMKEVLLSFLDPGTTSLLDPTYDKCYGNPEVNGAHRLDGRTRPTRAVRFGIGVEPNRAYARDIYSWNKVYHGTKKEFVNDIIKLGYLLKVGDLAPSGEVIGSRDQEKIAAGPGRFTLRTRIRDGRVYDATAEGEFEPNKFVYTSPSFLYARHRVYAEPFHLRDGRRFCVVLEFRLRPGSFRNNGQTLGSSEIVRDPAVEEDQFEHFTARHGVMVVTGLILVPLTRPRQSCGCEVWALSPSPMPVLSDMTRSCPNARQRWAVLRHLGLHPLMFNHQFDRCYCGCRALPDTIREGPADKPRRYVLPRPYTRFALHVDHRRERAWGFFKDWHTCFHGTTFPALASIIDCGYLLYPGCVNAAGEEVMARVERDGLRDSASDVCSGSGEGEDGDGALICVSPSAAYAGHPVYAKPWKVGGRTYSVILQLKIKADTYRVGRSTVRDLPEGYDRFIPNAQMEWLTRRHGTLVLYGILVKDHGDA